MTISPQGQSAFQPETESSQAAHSPSHDSDTQEDDSTSEDKLDDGKGNTIVRDNQERSKKNVVQ